MTDSIRMLLANKVAAQGVEAVALRMGYSQSKLANACNRIEAVLNDTRLRVGCGDYDFRYSDKEFLMQMAQVLQVNHDAVRRKISAVERQIEGELQAFRAWIFVETGFRRTGEPIFALAAMESKRRIPLALEVCMMSRSSLLKKSREIVQDHYSETNGQLPLWGAIKQYKLILSETEQALLDTSGNLMEVAPVTLSSHASISIS